MGTVDFHAILRGHAGVINDNLLHSEPLGREFLKRTPGPLPVFAAKWHLVGRRLPRHFFPAAGAATCPANPSAVRRFVLTLRCWRTAACRRAAAPAAIWPRSKTFPTRSPR